MIYILGEGDIEMKPINQCKTKKEVEEWVEVKTKKIDQEIVNAVHIAQSQFQKIINRAGEQLNRIKKDT
jgi:hypothetical protein